MIHETLISLWQTKYHEQTMRDPSVVTPKMDLYLTYN